MVKLLTYLKKDDILEFTEYKGNEVIQKMFSHCLREYEKGIKSKVIDMIEAKKNGKCLNLNNVFALTHIRLDEADDIKIAVGVFRSGVKIGKSKKVKALICLVIPANKSQVYLSLIAHLTRLLSESSAEEVFRIGNREGIIEFIRDFEEF